MKKVFILFFLIFLSGCATLNTDSKPVKPDPNSYVCNQAFGLSFCEYNDYLIEIISEPAGAKIE